MLATLNRHVMSILYSSNKQGNL